MALAQRLTYTIDDIYALPDGQRAELIDGQMYMMAPPNARHQDIIFSLSRKIADYIDINKGSCKIYLAPYAVFLNADDKNYVEPDISVICDKSKLEDKGCNGAPDWIVEVISPSTQRMDYSIKLFKYRTAGVREYWIVDPEARTAAVYTLEGGSYRSPAALYRAGASVPVGVLEGFQVDLRTVFPELEREEK